MLYSLSSAISPHLTVTSAAKKIAGDRPYCLSMPDGKAPRPLAFVRMPHFFSFMWSSWPKDYDASVYVEKAPYEYELWRIKDSKHYKTEWRAELKAVPCQTEIGYVDKSWPRPQARYITAFIDNKIYKFPAAKTTVRTTGVHLYYRSKITPTMIDTSGRAGIYHLAPPSEHPRYAETDWHWKDKVEISQDPPPEMRGWRYTPGPLYYQTKADITPAADIVCESSCFLRFHKEPFDYYVEIPKQRIEAWRQIYDEVTTEVEGWRVDNIQSDTAPSP